MTQRAPAGAFKSMNVSELEAKNRTYHEAQDHMELLPNYYVWTYGAFRDYLRGTVVELGCGSGIGISTYVDNTTRIYAVDYNEELVRRIQQRFQSSKVVPIQADLIGDWHELSGITADAVIMMDVLEHFAEDKTILEKAWSLLRPDGHLLVKVPAQRALFSSLDQASGHFRRYDEKDLRALAAAVGYETVRIRHINPVGALAYRLKSGKTTNFSRTFSMPQLRFINTVLPVLRLFDNVPLLPGLSLAAVFRRPR
jgi:2-polyprenyl-3-methyl-5-hydroxy-6-metoxy-1,4-benzoquinol methylase